MDSTLSNYNIPADESQKLLDQEIEANLTKFASHLVDVEKCRETLRALRSKRNQIAPISNLPLEIICNIFLLLQMDEEHNWRRWIYLAHVNRHWRDVVFGFPALWNNSPPLALPHWVDEILRRSPDKVSNFSLSANMDCRRSVRGLKKILRSSPEIKSLSITNLLSAYQLGDMGFGRLQKFAPRLQALCIASPAGYGAQDTHLDDEFIIPEYVLAVAAKLRRLELSDCKVHWGTYILPQITHLKLHDLSTIDRPTFSEFMNALGKATNLQHLDLVTFPHLQCLNVSGAVLQVRDFFTGITIRSSTQINVKLRLVDGPNLRFVRPLSSMASARARGARLRSGRDSCVIRTVVMGQTTCLRKGVRLLLLTDAFGGPEDALTMYENTASVSLLLEWEEISSSTLRATIVNQAIADVFQCGFLLNEVSHLHLDASDIEPFTLMTTIGVLPAVSFIKVEGSIVKPFINALHPMQRHHIQDGRLYFPNLQSIRIEDSAFRSSSAGCLSFRLFRDCLKKRLLRDVAIRKLVLLDCENLVEEEIGVLRKIVGDVEWDGVVDDWYPGLEDGDDENDGENDEENDYSSSYSDSDSDSDEGDHSSTDSESEDQALSASESEATDLDT
ncbi:hypothetical protein HYPSUDRAFT_34251 [Hypholoma sublateritium FD-334 SS-4]|uniref:Uncharacterized protein n=1 Tax=Hypholoma sublateritium (strain FD-334 SS-4) TaxID=945553 RepID=A0A0D2MVH7_HYPSF|nr:hypothetical protein HYPSUDRAFT_34251 [Hypholoma sublateritium FD-334 SS-4]